MYVFWKAKTEKLVTCCMSPLNVHFKPNILYSLNSPYSSSKSSQLLYPALWSYKDLLGSINLCCLLNLSRQWSDWATLENHMSSSPFWGRAQALFWTATGNIESIHKEKWMLHFLSLSLSHKIKITKGHGTMISVLQTRLLRLRAAQTLWHKVCFS